MKSFGWFLTGVVGGIALGHAIATSPTGRAIIDEVTAAGRNFVDGVKAGFDEGQASAKSDTETAA